MSSFSRNARRSNSVSRKDSFDFSVPGSPCGQRSKRAKRSQSCGTPTASLICGISTLSAQRQSSRVPTAKRSNSVGRKESTDLSLPTSPNLHRISARNSCIKTPSDRKQFNEQAARIVGTLRVHFGKDYLPLGLRSMSSKQFITTMAYFMKTVLGNSRGSRLDAAKLTVDDITKYLVEVGYSAKQSMSWMKTPNAPHAFNNLVDLFQWLCMFLPPGAEAHPFEKTENLQDVGNLFPNIEYVGLFGSTIKENFSLWNNQQNEEYESSKAQLIDKYICTQTDGRIRSKAEIEIETARNKREYADQLKKRFSGQDQKKMEDLMAKEMQLNADIKELSALCNVKTTKRDEIQSQRHQLELTVKELTEQAFELEKTIARQPYTRNQLEVQIVSLTQKIQLIELHKNSVNQLQDMGLDNQIQFARSYSQQSKVADNFNSMVHEKFLALGETYCYNFNVDDLTINMKDMTDLPSQIDRIFCNFDVIRQRNNTESENIRGKIGSLKGLFQAAETNVSVKMAHYESLMEHVTKLEVELKEVESELKSASQLRKSASDKVNAEIERLNLSIDAKKPTLSKLKDQIVEIKHDNNVHMKNYERIGEEIVQNKRKRLELQRIALNQVHLSVEKLKIEMKELK